MADLFRIVTIPPGGRPVSSLDMNDGVTYFKIRDSLKLVAGGRNQQSVSPSGVRYAGSTVAAESLDNATLTWTCAVRGGTQDLALANVEALVAAFETFLPAGLGTEYVEYRPGGATYPVYYDVRGPATWTWNYASTLFAGANFSTVDISLPIAPLALLPKMDVIDDFSVNSLADYTAPDGTGSVTVAGGVLAPAVAATRRFIHSVRGYQHADVQVTVKWFSGTGTGNNNGVILKYIDASNYLLCYNDSAGFVRVGKVVAGTLTALASTAIANATGQTRWIRGRMVGNLVTVEGWPLAPAPAGAGSPTSSASYTLAAGAEVTQFGSTVRGLVGIYASPSTTDQTFDDFTVEPYTYPAFSSPGELRLTGIPGTAPAKVDIVTTDTGGASHALWPLVSWYPTPLPINQCWNGDFETGSTGNEGWLITAVAGLTAAAGAVATLAAQPTKYGQSRALVTMSATALSAVSFPIYRTFTAGTTYNLSAWVAQQLGAAASTRIGMGTPTDNSFSAYTAIASNTYEQRTATWTPATTVQLAYIVIGNDATAVANQFNLDGVVAYEGSVPPSTTRQAEGGGAWGPGLIRGVGGGQTPTGGWQITADANAFGGNALSIASTATSLSADYSWWFDPTLLPPDPFAQGEVDVEFWARIKHDPTNSRALIYFSAQPEQSIGAERFTHEYGGGGASGGTLIGKTLTRPTAGSTGYRLYRLGVITLPTTGQRWRIYFWVTLPATSAGPFALDYLMAVPAASRVCGPTNKPADTSYPSFTGGLGGEMTTMTSDLRVVKSNARYPTQTASGPAALAGPPIEFPPGNVSVFIKHSSGPPDDTRTTTATTPDETTRPSLQTHFSVQPRAYVVRGS